MAVRLLTRVQHDACFKAPIRYFGHFVIDSKEE